LATFSSTALALAVIASFLLAAGGIRLLLGKETRSRGALMLTAAAVLFVNVLIWTL
jgi:high-affinity Fe2+/Pb2+ permease